MELILILVGAYFLLSSKDVSGSTRERDAIDKEAADVRRNENRSPEDAKTYMESTGWVATETQADKFLQDFAPQLIVNIDSVQKLVKIDIPNVIAEQNPDVMRYFAKNPNIVVSFVSEVTKNIPSKFVETAIPDISELMKMADGSSGTYQSGTKTKVMYTTGTLRSDWRDPFLIGPNLIMALQRAERAGEITNEQARLFYAKRMNDYKLGKINPVMPLTKSNVTKAVTKPKKSGRTITTKASGRYIRR